MGVGLAMLALLAAADPTPPDQFGYVWPCPCGLPAVAELHEGDLVFTTSFAPMRYPFYALAGSSHPHHVAVAIRCTDGRLHLLEAELKEPTRLSPAFESLCKYCQEAWRPAVWVRRLKRPLTLEETARLRSFAAQQLGKPYGPVRRLVLLPVPALRGAPSSVDQPKWFCSELTAAALQHIGLWPADAPQPCRTLPSEMFFDGKCKLCWWYDPPMRWTPSPCPPGNDPLLWPRRWMRKGY